MQSVHAVLGTALVQATGNSNENVDPTPSVDSTRMLAMMLFDDVPGDRQAQAGPAGLAADPRPIHLVEPLEQAVLGGLRDADPMVRHRDHDRLAGLAHQDRDVAAIRAELDRVVDEVDEHLAETFGVAADRADRRRDVDLQGHALAVGEQAQPLGRLDGGAREVDVLERAEAAAALDPREVEQLADHLDEVAGLDLDLGDPVAHLGRQGVADLVGLAGQRLGEQAHGRQRGAQLVGEVVDELGPDALEPAEFRDVGEQQRRSAAGASRSPGSR